jgi:hypothetical protein
MKTLKKTKKVVKPDFIMNCTNCKTSTDVYNELVNAKVRAGKSISMDELEIAKNVAVAEADPTVITFVKCDVVTSKKPWYKRFWNWLRRK